MKDTTPGDPLALHDAPSVDARPEDSDGSAARRGRLGEEFTILDVKRGGMGEVYICKKDGDSHPRVALKTFQKRFFFNRAHREAFSREVSIWARLTGLFHVMPVFGIYHFDGRPFVIMPEVEPGPSGEVTVRDLVRKGPLPIERALQFAEETARGLGDAEERIPGIVHGDIKPDNLLLWDERVSVSDFGLAQIATNPDDGDPLESTWAYRAPELWERRAKASHASDVYAFGVLFYELLTGKTPFSAASREAWARAHREERPEPPAGFPAEGAEAHAMKLALRALAKDPRERPSGFAKIADEIEEIDPAARLMTLLSLARKAAEKASQSPRARPDPPEVRERGLLGLRVRNLLSHGDAAQALAELDAAPEELLDAALMIHRGTALSLLNCDEEAVRCFEVAGSGELSTDLRQTCMSELALSLKRLKRFDEAVRIYTDMLREAPESMMECVLTNLASVYLESGRPREAVRCVGNFAMTHPESFHAWTHLGTAFKDLGNYDDANRAFQCALRTAPDQPVALVKWAEVHLLQKQPERALATLDLAYQQGFTSRDWFVITQACHLFMGRTDRYDALKERVEPLFSPTEIEENRRRITALARKASAEPGGPSVESAPEHGARPAEQDRGALARRVQSLLQQRDATRALAELDAAPPELIDAELMVWRGDALFTSDRHEEAVHSFKAALEGELSAELRQKCMNELGLSLKRLKRFDEAVPIYTDMLRDAKEEMIEGAVVNLATVYFESDKPEEAVECLRPFALDHPESVHAWANLGVAYRALGRYDDADEALHRARRADPNNAWVLVKAAEVHILRMQLDKAVAALHRAYEQGYRSLGWLGAAQVCNLLAGDEERFDALNEEARRTLSDADRDELHRGIIALATEASQAQRISSAGSASNGAMARDVQSFEMPFTNIRYIAGESMYVIDFYHDVRSEDYPDRLARALRNAARNTALQVGNFVLRTTPFYFTFCPSCEIEVLTNRDHGAPLRCRRCDWLHGTAPIAGRADLTALLDKVVAAIGKKQVTCSRLVIVLLKVGDDTKTDRVKELANEAGFVPIPKNHPGVTWLRSEHLKRGALKIEDEYLAYQRLIEEGAADYENQTPQVFERLIRRVRTECGALVSASMSCDPGDHSPDGLMLQGRLDEALSELRRRTAEDPGDLGALETLVSILAQKGDLEEARAQAELATRVGPASAALWSALGMIELRLGRLGEAASACERALKLDPLDRLALIVLSGVYPKLGRAAEAAELRCRLDAFGPVG